MSDDTTILDRDTTTDTTDQTQTQTTTDQTQTQQTDQTQTTTDQTDQTTQTTTDAQTTTDDPWWKPYAGDDGKREEKLKRFTDPGAVFDAWENANRMLSDQDRVKIPGADADEKDISVFNRIVGVPESHDGYKIDFDKPDGFEAFDEADQEILGKLTESWHKQGGLMAHPQVINAVHQAYAEISTAEMAGTIAHAQEVAQNTEKQLKAEWQGDDFKRNQEHAMNALSRYTPKDELEKMPEEQRNIMRWRLDDGTRVGDHPVFVKMFAAIGADFGEDPVWTEAAKHGGNPGQTLQEEKAAIMALREKGDMKAYAEKQDRLLEINNALQRNKS